MGGSLVKLASNPEVNELYWLILTSIWQPKWSEYAINSRDNAINQVAGKLNISNVIKWDYKDNQLDTIPLNNLQEKLISVLDKIQPNIIFTPSPWDFNHEHKIAYELVEMSTKPYYSTYINSIFAYEIPSSSDAAFSASKNFKFNYYINIENYIEDKIELIKYYETELKQPPHPRSKEYIRALAVVRGGESGLNFAEGFNLVRSYER